MIPSKQIGPLRLTQGIAKLRARGIAIIAEPFILPAISRKLAFFADPFGNLVELAEVRP